MTRSTLTLLSQCSSVNRESDKKSYLEKLVRRPKLHAQQRRVPKTFRFQIVYSRLLSSETFPSYIKTLKLKIKQYGPLKAAINNERNIFIIYDFLLDVANRFDKFLIQNSHRHSRSFILNSSLRSALHDS